MKLIDEIARAATRLVKKPAKTDRGEQMAADFLKEKGFLILERNFRCRRGEIDIVCSDGGTLCFVEVKSRSNFAHGFPEEFVDRRKRKKITIAASEYIKKNRVESKPMRFDVVAVDLSKGGVKLLEGAFEAEF
ncbi:YraN family protein [Candidatus Mycalebacterium sp.]